MFFAGTHFSVCLLVNNSKCCKWTFHEMLNMAKGNVKDRVFKVLSKIQETSPQYFHLCKSNPHVDDTQ